MIQEQKIEGAGGPTLRKGSQCKLMHIVNGAKTVKTLQEASVTT